MSPLLSIHRAAMLFVLAVALLAGISARHTGTSARPRGTLAAEDASRFLDLSLPVAPEYPCTWPTFPPFQLNHYQRIGPTSAYRTDRAITSRNEGMG